MNHFFSTNDSKQSTAHERAVKVARFLLTFLSECVLESIWRSIPRLEGGRVRAILYDILNCEGCFMRYLTPLKGFFSLCALYVMMPFHLFSAEGIDTNAPPMDSGLWQSFAMLAIAFGFFYLILWRPEQRRRQEIEQKREKMQKGDRVTAMGIVGSVAEIKDQTVILKMVDGSKIEVLKAAISDVMSEKGGT